MPTVRYSGNTFYPLHMTKHLFLATGLFLTGYTSHAQWTNQPIPFNGQAVANHLDAVSPTVCWVAAVDQITFVPNHDFARTLDGGTTWSIGSISQLNPEEEISALAAIDGTTAVVASHENGVGGRILRTTNGGTTWTVQTAAKQLDYPLMLHFFTPLLGVCVGEARTGSTKFEIYRTTDGGVTWAAVPDANLPNIVSGEGTTGYPFGQGTNFWFITDKGRVFRSADQGLTWSVSDTGLNRFVQTIAFRDNLNGVAVAVSTTSTAHRMAKTADGGATWQPMTYTGPLRGWQLAYVPGTANLLAVGLNRYGANSDYGSSVSRDNGQTWTALETTREHIRLDAFSANAVWTGAYTSVTGAGLGVYKLNANVLAARPDAAPTALRAFPNPAPGGRFRVALGAASSAPVAAEVLDALGRSVYKFAGPGSSELVLDLRGQPAGIYLLRLQAGGTTSQQKLLID
jgi:photosystem II stability/assembly factor-like uncharacterized protein